MGTKKKQAECTEEVREKRRADSRRYYAEHRPTIRAQKKESLARNRDATLVRQKAWRNSEAGRTYRVAYAAVYYADPVTRMRLLVNGAFGRARKAGLPLDPALRVVLTENPPTLCTCCGVSLDYSMGRGRNNRWLSPSLDRIENAKGYVLGNVEVICMRCNSIKSDTTLEHLESLVAYIRKHRTS